MPFRKLPFTDEDWDPLLEYLDKGRIVPVVGANLLSVGKGSSAIPLQAHLAEKLAAALEVEPGSLNEVACRVLERGGELSRVYSNLKRVTTEERLAVPEPLKKLAAIEPFDLYVSTTFDPLMETALNQERFGGRQQTQTFSFSPESPEDLPESFKTLRRPTVFHLFGRLSAIPDYAITEADLLEWLHHLQSDTKRPQRLFDELSRNHLLILGSGFSGWLARFFIRATKREALSVTQTRDILVGEGVRQDSGLAVFLQHFSARTKVFPGSAVEFIDELHRRWTAASAAAAPAPQPAPELAGMKSGSIFVSYAREDVVAARAIRDALGEAGLDVWLDESKLEPGDRWASKIDSTIEEASIFVPLVSQSTLTSAKRFFRREWRHALETAKEVSPAQTFIVPVAIDETSSSDERLPSELGTYHFVRLPRGVPTPEFIEAMKKIYRGNEVATE